MKSGKLKTENGKRAAAVAIPDEVGINIQDSQDFARNASRRTEQAEKQKTKSGNMVRRRLACKMRKIIFNY